MSDNNVVDGMTDAERADFDAWQEQVRGTNINEATLLATDYLNHFNEIVMTLEMVPMMPEILEEAKEWQPKSYKDHFRDSTIADKDLAVEAYDHVPAAFRDPFETTVSQLDNLVAATIQRLEKQLEAGETGEVVVTLLNKTYPMLRFGMGDLSYYTDEPCPCGRTSRRLLGILGRIGEAVKVRGMFVHGKELQGALSKFPEVSRFQAVVDRVAHRDDFVLSIELREGVDGQGLLEGLHKAVQEGCRVRADRIEFVAQGTIPDDAKAIEDRRTWE